jgi:hypothetical protein
MKHDLKPFGRLAGLAAALVIVGSANAAAFDPQQFLICDGYPTPRGTANGLGNLQRPPSYSADAVTLCDMALNDPRLPPADRLRRATLLTAKALHHLAAGSPREALADLDLAETAFKASISDPAFDDSLGLQIRLVRVYASNKLGQSEQALANASAAVRDRPYTRKAIKAALAAIGPNRAGPEVTLLNRRLGILDPSMIDALFVEAMIAHDYRTAIDLYPCLIAPPIAESNFANRRERLAHDLIEWGRTQTFWAARTGAYAYALSAIGERERADIVMNLAHQRVLAAQPNTLDGVDVVERRTVLPDGFADRMDRAVTLTRSESDKLLDRWRTQIASRGPPLAPPEPASAPSDPWLNTPARDVQQFADSLPPFEPAWARSKWGSQRYQEQHWQIVAPGMNAPIQLPNQSWSAPSDGPSFICRKAPVETGCEDMVLLGAARGALKAGATGFIVIQRQGIENFEKLSYSTPWLTGFGAQIDVIYVRSGERPPMAGADGWRILDAAAVEATLAAAYPQVK